MFTVDQQNTYKPFQLPFYRFTQVSWLSLERFELEFLQARCPSWCPTNSVHAL